MAKKKTLLIVPVVLLISLFALILLNVPIGVCLGLSSALAFMTSGNTDLMVVVQRMMRQIDSTTLLAIPLFIFGGKIMERGGISKRLLNLANVFFGRIQGGEKGNGNLLTTY